MKVRACILPLVQKGREGGGGFCTKFCFNHHTFVMTSLVGTDESRSLSTQMTFLTGWVFDPKIPELQKPNPCASDQSIIVV